MNNASKNLLARMRTTMPVAFLVTLCVFAMHFFAHFLPISSIHFTFFDHSVAELIYSAILLGVICLRYSRAKAASERFFWFSLILAFVVWCLAKISFLLIKVVDTDLIGQQLGDFGYFAFFLIVIFGISQKPYLKNVSESISLSQIASLMFAVASFSYLVLVPSQVNVQEYEKYNSSFIYYMMMDVYLLSVLAIEATRIQQKEWRTRYVSLAIAFALFFLLDIIEILSLSNKISIEHGGIIEMLWFTPYLALMFAVSYTNDESGPDSSNSSKQTLVLPSRIVVLTFVLPITHSVGYAFGIFSEQSHALREMTLTLWLLVFGMMIIIRDRKSNAVPAPQTKTQKHIQNESLGNHIIDIDQLPFPCIKLDNAGRIQQTNIALLNLLDYEFGDIEGQLFGMLLDKNDPLEQLFRFADNKLNTQIGTTGEVVEIHLQPKNGEAIPCYLGFANQQDGCYLANIVDISSLKTAEEQALSIKDKFIANITHEFRTPLTIINGAVEEGLEQIQQPKLFSRLQAAKANTTRVLKMVEQLLTLSKLTSAPKIQPTAQPLSEISRLAGTSFEPMATQRNITFDYQIAPSLWANISDDSLEQILFNLLSNAFKYTPEEGKVSLQLESTDKTALIRISDSGPGISTSQQQQIFQRFQRATQHQNSNTFGVGIGLALVNELVTVHDWKLTLDSDENQGACFCLHIPLIEQPQEVAVHVRDFSYQLDELTPEMEIESEQVSTNNTNRLLIIEDNPDMQEYLSHLMEDQYSVQVAGLGEKGIETAIEQVPDIVICDLMLPDISGFDVIEHLKNNEVTAHIPILMLTARSDMNSRLEGLERKADDYLTKPFHHKELNLRLKNLLSARQDIQAKLKASFKQELETLTSNRLQALSQESSENAQEKQVNKFINAMETITSKHFTDETFGLTEMASTLAMSERQLQRKVKALLDMTPGEYLKQFRLIQARNQLLEGKPIGLIASDVGFTSQAYFTKCFKETFSMTPSQYQKQASASNPE